MNADVISVFIKSKFMIMKTLRYILIVFMLITILASYSQIPITNHQVITLQSVPDHASAKLLSESKQILLRRLTSMNLRNVQITQNNSASELVITVGDTISYATLTETLLAQGSISFKVDSIQVLNQDDILEAHADFVNPLQPTLCITFKEKVQKLFEDITIHNLNKPLAFIVDNKVYAAPRIMDKISHGKISLLGSGFSKTEVRKLVAIISSGLLPLKFTTVSDN